jgi:hypothetical protein
MSVSPMRTLPVRKTVARGNQLEQQAPRQLETLARVLFVKSGFSFSGAISDPLDVHGY